MLIKKIFSFFRTSKKSSCDICHQTFSEANIKSFLNYRFCTKHYTLFRSIEWVPFLTVQANHKSNSPFLWVYETKKSLWKSKKVPCLLDVNYRINEKYLEIETLVTVCVPKSSMKIISKELTKGNGSAVETVHAD